MELSEAEKKRIARDERTRRNRRGRNNPSAVPAKLTRTSAFAPRRVGLEINKSIERVFHVPGHSLIVVKGGELGTQHRDMIYALFRLKDKITSYRMRNPKAPLNGSTDGVPTHIEIVESVVSWRDLLRTMGRTEHVNNLMTAKNIMEDLRQVVMTVYEGDPDEVMRRLENGRLPQGKGQITGVIDQVEWDGVNLDSRVTVRWGRGVLTAIRTRHLVSLNAEVQFALKSDYAKTFWPFIDSNPNHAYIDETMLASLVARELYGPNETNGTRSQFRRDTRNAFEDMVRAGGLKSFRIDLIGQGRLKMRRYFYEHALPRAVDRPQLELQLDLQPSAAAAEARPAA